MFYTKYRPQKFTEISRPNEAADALSRQILTNKTVHAYLFVGPRGTGKTSTARILSKALNCEHLDKTGDPCDECSSCLAIKAGSFLDLIEIDAASNRGIDDIRDLKTKVRLAPVSGSYKIYIIDEVHMLTTEAFNALLKTLEEPPQNTVFILCTTELHKVPDTIKSRCQVFKFKRATIKQLVSKLEHIAKEENIKISTIDLEKIARASLGGFRDAETLLQQIGEGEVDIDAMLNVGSWDSYIEFVSSLLDKDAASAIKVINKVYEDGLDLYVWCGELLKYLRDLLLIKSGVNEDFLEVTEEVLESIKEQSAKIGTGQLVNLLDSFVIAHNTIKTNAISQLPIEIAIVRVCGYDQGNEYINESKAPMSPKPSSSPKKTKTQTENFNSEEKGMGVEEGATEQLVEDSLAAVAELTENIIVRDLPTEIDVSEVKDKWAVIIEKMNDLNRSLLALLKASNPVRIEGRTLVLEVFYAFHKERLESPKNRKVVENVLKEIVDVEMSIKCVLSNEKPKKLRENEVGMLTDMNVIMPARPQVVDQDAALGMLDGELPF